MAIWDRTAESLTPEDIQSLIDANVPEGKNIEYKRELPGNSREDRKEFLADIVSFANAAGGLLLFGIEESNGLPSQITGISTEGVDDAILRLDNLARDGITERIPGLRFAQVVLPEGRAVLVARIPRSWAGPHMVIFGGASRFYSRNSRGKYQMDLIELRRAFAARETARDYIREFRMNRVQTVLQRMTPIPIPDGPCTILHVVPLAAAAHEATIDVSDFVPGDVPLAGPSSSRIDQGRHNFDGYVSHPQADDSGVTPSYAQLFRDGSIEGVSASLIRKDDDDLVRSVLVESVMIRATRRYLTLERELSIDPPFIVMITLVGIQGFRIEPNTEGGRMLYPSNRLPLDRNVLPLPEIVFEESEPNVPSALRPAFDTLWQTGGWPRSLNYDDRGIHVSERLE